MNSWQSPVAGEPSFGTIHPHYKELVANAASAGYAAVDLSAEVPKSAKAIYIDMEFVSGTAGRWIGAYTDSTPTPAQPFVRVFCPDGTKTANGSGFVTLTTDRKFWYRASAAITSIYIRMFFYSS
jgi:hypothetical protein